LKVPTLMLVCSLVLTWLLLVARCGLCTATATGGGSSSMGVLFNAWFLSYNAVKPGRALTYVAGDSAFGMKGVLDGSLNWGVSELPVAELPTIYSFPLVRSPVCLAYNLAQIFTGQLTHWNDSVLCGLNPTLCGLAMPIRTVVRGAGSGTTFAFTSALSRNDETWRAERGIFSSWNASLFPPSWIQVATTLAVASTVLTQPYSFSYLALSYAETFGLPCAELVMPLGTFSVDSTSWPIISSASLLISGDAANCTDTSLALYVSLIHHLGTDLLYKAFPSVGAVIVHNTAERNPEWLLAPQRGGSSGCG
jgi:ABC-type phosphate transport system substrate-binding protein